MLENACKSFPLFINCGWWVVNHCWTTSGLYIREQLFHFILPWWMNILVSHTSKKQKLFIGMREHILQHQNWTHLGWKTFKITFLCCELSSNDLTYFQVSTTGVFAMQFSRTSVVLKSSHQKKFFLIRGGMRRSKWFEKFYLKKTGQTLFIVSHSLKFSKFVFWSELEFYPFQRTQTLWNSFQTFST